MTKTKAIEQLKGLFRQLQTETDIEQIRQLGRQLERAVGELRRASAEVKVPPIVETVDVSQYETKIKRLKQELKQAVNENNLLLLLHQKTPTVACTTDEVKARILGPCLRQLGDAVADGTTSMEFADALTKAMDACLNKLGENWNKIYEWHDRQYHHLRLALSYYIAKHGDVSFSAEECPLIKFKIDIKDSKIHCQKRNK